MVPTTLLDSTENPTLAIGLDGRIINLNQPAMELMGWEKEEIQGLDIKNIPISPPVMELVQNNINRMKRGEVINQNIFINERDGERFQTNLQVSVQQNEQESIIYLVFDSQGKSTRQQIKIANKILTEVDTVLGEEVDYEAMLRKLVDFVIPQVADICAIHLIQPDGSTERVALAPSTIINNKPINDWLDNDLPNDEDEGLIAAIHHSSPVLVTEVSPVRRAAKAGICSYMILPLISHRKTIGAITLIAVNPGGSFNQNIFDLAENLAIHMSIYLEKSRLHKESQKLKSELEQRVAERTAELSEAVSQLKQSEQIIQTLFRISKKLNSTLDVDSIFDELAQEAIGIVNGESGFAGLRTAEGMNVKKYFVGGEAFPFEYTWKAGEGIPGWVLKYKVPYGTSDAANDPLIRSQLDINNNVRSIICTPILDSIGEVIGYFDIRNKIGAEGFTINDQEMLLMLAPVASIAIQNALAYQQRLESVAELKESSRQLEELAAKLESTREEERMRISRELHDQLGQSLTAMKFDLTALAEQLINVDENLSHKSKDLMTQVNIMIKTVRRISTELRPGMLDDLGLIASIEWQAGDFQKRTGIECKINAVENELHLSKEQSLAVFRIFQEALTNVARYAEASHVDINIYKNGDQLYFIFNDDGRGIKAEEISGGRSLGLLGMRERVKHIGGTFDINGSPGEGTVIRVIIPLQVSK